MKKNFSVADIKHSKMFNEPGEEAQDLIYHIDRYWKDTSPMCVYIPSKEVIFKMMRACIGCTSVKDLWIYNE